MSRGPWTDACMLLDTGASACFVSDACVRRMRGVQVTPVVDRRFLTADKKCVDVLGCVNLLCECCNLKPMSLMLFVIRDLAFDVVLGRDFFSMFGVRLVIPGSEDVAVVGRAGSCMPLGPWPGRGKGGVVGDGPAEDPRAPTSCQTDCLGEMYSPEGSCIREDALSDRIPTHPLGASLPEAAPGGSADAGIHVGRLDCFSTPPVLDSGYELLCEVYEEPEIEEMGMPGNEVSMVEDPRVKQILSRYPRVITSELSAVPCAVDSHRIELIDGARPYKRAYYKVGPKERQFIEEQIKTLLELGVIEPSRSPWGSPIVLVKKADGSFRMCIDYRKLNEASKTETYPLPFLEDVVDRLRGKRVFSKIDLKSGYWQIQMSSDGVDKTAFVTHMGAFQWRRMPFGLKNATATFQRIMRSVLSGLEFCTEVHVDDILIFSESEEEHLVHLERVFERLAEANLVVNLPKCRFMQRELVFVGHKFTSQGVSPDPAKLDAIRRLQPPRDVTGVRALLGLLNYYRRFVKDFARIADPLTRLTTKGAEFVWTERHQSAFCELRDALLRSNLLAHPDFSKPFKVTTDASDRAVGAMLSQEDDAGHDAPVAFYSRKLEPAQLNYDIVEKECLAIIEAVKQWRHYLSHARFLIETDHKPLTWLHSLKDPSRRQVRWSILMQEFGYEIKHKPGKANVVPDALSRLHAIHDDTDDWDQFERLLVHYVTHGEHEPAALAAGLITRSTKARITRVAQHLSVGVDGALQHKGRPIPPADQRAGIIDRAHLVGHYGASATVCKIAERYWWPGMYQSVMRHIGNCRECAQYNDDTGGTRIKTAEQHMITRGVFDVVAVDFVGPLPATPRGNKYLLQFSCQQSDYVEWFPAPANSEKVVAEFFVREIIARYGPPTHLLSDRGKEFCNRLVDAISEVSGTLRKVTSGYRPQTNGRCEKRNHLLIQVVRKYAAANPEDWDLWVPFALIADRNRPRSATGYSPMYLMFGRESALFADFSALPDVDPQSPEAITTRIAHLNKLMEVVHPQLTDKRVAASSRAKTELSKIPALDPGTYVMVKRKDYQKIPKLQPRYTGLYRVFERTANGNYKLEALRGRVYPQPMHPSRLRPVGKELALKLLTDASFRPEVDDPGDEEEYEVERIVNHRVTRRQGLQYEIKWLGYSDTTWEPESSLTNCEQALSDYWEGQHRQQQNVIASVPASCSAHPPVVVPDELREAIITLPRPWPTKALQEWLHTHIGQLDVDLFPFQEKASFCHETLSERVRHVTEVRDGVTLSAWLNAPFGLLQEAIAWASVALPSAELHVLVPEWITTEMLAKTGDRMIVRKETPVTLRSTDCFMWPTGDRRVTGWQCRVVLMTRLC